MSRKLLFRSKVTHLDFPNVVNNHEQAREASHKVHPLAEGNPLFEDVMVVDAGRIVEELEGLVDVHNEPVNDHHREETDFPPRLVNLEVGLLGKGDFEGDEPEVEDRREKDDVDQAEELDQQQMRSDFGEVEREGQIVEYQHETFHSDRTRAYPARRLSSAPAESSF